LLTSAFFNGSELLRSYVRQARAGNTQRAYQAQWQQFAAWCEQRRTSALPADPPLVAEYLAERAQLGSAVGSIDVMLAAVGFMHQMSGFTFARRHPILKLVLDGIRRQHVAQQPQAAPLTGRLLSQVLAGLGDGAIDRRNAALLSLLYAFALRASEVVALDWLQRGDGQGWLSFGADRLEIVLLGSKACQQRAQQVAIPAAANPRVLTALQRWIDLAQVAPGEPLVRPVARGGSVRRSRLDTASVSGIIKRVMACHLQQTGVSPVEAAQHARRFSGHSGRIGLYVAAAEAGVPAQHIAALARHCSMTVALRYTRQAELLRCSPHARPGVGV
jgi:site-specific recombinase XerC